MVMSGNRSTDSRRRTAFPSTTVISDSIKIRIGLRRASRVSHIGLAWYCGAVKNTIGNFWSLPGSWRLAVFPSVPHAGISKEVHAVPFHSQMDYPPVRNSDPLAMETKSCTESSVHSGWTHGTSLGL